MAWTRYTCGRLKSDYQYSVHIVYNNFPWPQDVPEEKRRAIAQAADAVLAARRAHPDATLAALRSEEHTSELQSLMRISYAVFCLKNKHNNPKHYKNMQD